MALSERETAEVPLALEALADAAQAAALADSPAAALHAFARAAATACRARLAVVRSHEPDGTLAARAVYAESAADAALAEGSRVDAAALAERSNGSLHVPVRLGGELLGSLELRRAGADFGPQEELVARIAADQLALALRAAAVPRLDGAPPRLEPVLALAGEALAAGVEEERTPLHVARVAAEATRADAAYVWSADGRLIASHGASGLDDGALAQAALRVLGSLEFVALDEVDGAVLASARLGEPPLGVLQVVLPAGRERGALDGLGTFALRAAHTLRMNESARSTALELQRTRALLAVVGQATAQLSLAHTLATAIEQVAALLGAERVAVYLRQEGRLLAAAGRGLAGPHAVVAEALLSLLLGPFRGRGLVAVDDLSREPRLAAAQEAAQEAGIESVLALPLTVHGDTIGLLALYPEAGRDVDEHERSLLAALAAQLAVAVQNARLHEDATRLRDELQSALDAEKQAARRVLALYEVSRSFSERLSVEETLDALAKNAAQLLDVDAAAIRMPDARRELLTTRALHVADERIAAPARTVLERPQPFAALPIQRLFRTRRPLRLDATLARELGGAHELLLPFLEKGSTAAVIPIATPAEVVAALTIVSFDPGRPITRETIDTALSIAAQAALAIDNGRLYQQQKEFSDMMQRSLLPRSHPELPGLEIGEVYESSARVDVGGDVYDFLELDEQKLAVVLGDVTGHGIEATADMAMAKFVFRSLAREHPDPGDFLAAANEVVVGEIAPGKFITMAYLTIDATTGEVVAASGGHPAPYIVPPTGDVRPLAVRGLALGVDTDQTYETASETIERGASVVLFTDGVVEARRERELYGPDRLAEVLSRSRTLAPRDLARVVVDDCRAFAGGELTDDCAVVVLKRTG